MSDGARCHYCQKMPCQCPEFDVEATAPAPTPLERLVHWVTADPEYRVATMTYQGEIFSITLSAYAPSSKHHGAGDTLDTAILAALAQAEAKR